MTQKTLLLVEDSETQALKFQFQLEDAGYTVVWCPDAESGLEYLSHSNPDLILLDYFLPGMQGDAFCRMVRIKRSSKRIPILMLTSADTDASRRWLLDSGADDYIPKSVAFEVLQERIEILLAITRKHIYPEN